MNENIEKLLKIFMGMYVVLPKISENLLVIT